MPRSVRFSFVLHIFDGIICIVSSSLRSYFNLDVSNSQSLEVNANMVSEEGLTRLNRILESSGKVSHVAVYFRCVFFSGNLFECRLYRHCNSGAHSNGAEEGFG